MYNSSRMDILWFIAMALITYVYFTQPALAIGARVEPFARLRSYGHPYYWKLRNLPGGKAGDCHYKHYDSKCNCITKNVIYLD